MNLQIQPLVTLITPVYNGEKYLAECIESILVQTYQNWTYIIVNNCSTDRSLEIAEDYARKDSRIRIHNNQKFVGMIQNHNIAFRQISPESRYCNMPTIGCSLNVSCKWSKSPRLTHRSALLGPTDCTAPASAGMDCPI